MSVSPHVTRAGHSLRDSGAILLVSCYELGHQPLSLASASAFLRRAGFAPATLDLSVEPLDPARVERAGLIAIAVPMHTALRLGLRAGEQMRALNARAHLGYVGLYAGLNAEWLLEHGADSAIGGEWEDRLVALAEAIESGAVARGAIDGVSTRGHLAGPHLGRLEFALPMRDTLPPLARYARLDHDGGFALTGYVEASRGCKHTCLHCPIPPAYGGRFFALPREIVARDIDRLVAAGATHITFGDPDFLNGPTHALRVAGDLRAAHPGVTFDFTAKIEHVIRHAALIPSLVEAGALFMVSAVESLSDTVLRHLDKGHTRADVFRALEITRRAGLTLRPSLVAFTPWTTLDDWIDVLDTVEREDLIDAIDPVQYTIRLLVPPGSLLLERDAIRPYLAGFDPAAFGHRWVHPDPRMDTLHAEVTAIAAEATRTGEDVSVTFHRIRDRGLAAAGRIDASAPAHRARSAHGAEDAAARRHRAPRLTEPWFC
jgi:radical SAM superfamily enzyme YgiQ (UPF0313 family)